MATQITLAFTVRTAGTSYGAAKAAAAMDKTAISLYANPTNDPVLGQFFGLTVASDTTVAGSGEATRTIVLDMIQPPPFPCNPITATPPVPPYPLLTTKDLPGTFLTTPGSPTVPTSVSQKPSLTDGDVIQFLAQPGIFYEVNTGGVATGAITLSSNYTGPFSEDGGAVKMVQSLANIVAIYSTSPLDSDGVAITPALPAGSGARSVQLSCLRADGTPFTVTTPLTGKFPALVTTFGDTAAITAVSIASVGGFGSSVGQITVCELSAAPPYIRPDADMEDFQALTDQAQMLITRGLVYLPPSYFALSQQSYALQGPTPLLGEFTLPGRMAHASNVVGGKSVATSVDQSAGPALAAGNTVEFTAQPGVLYTLAAVGRGTITLETPWTGLNDNPIQSSAILVTPSPAAEPTSDQLSGAMGEFVNPGTAVPPPNQPLAPQTMSPTPTFLSGMFARALQLALAVPVEQSAIVVS